MHLAIGHTKCLLPRLDPLSWYPPPFSQTGEVPAGRLFSALVLPLEQGCDIVSQPLCTSPSTSCTPAPPNTTNRLVTHTCPIVIKYMYHWLANVASLNDTGDHGDVRLIMTKHTIYVVFSKCVILYCAL